MYDPKSVAHEIKLFGHYFITIWHVDPEMDGTDDSCGWAFPHLDEREKQYAENLIRDQYDNLSHWFGDLPEYDAISRIARIFRLHKSITRPWWKHPRWHIHHWSFQVHPVQKFKRWVFSRCAYCGGRFKWGAAPTSLKWHGTGPLWFRSEESIFHHECYLLHRDEMKKESSS